MTRHGVLYSHAHANRIDEHPDRLAAINSAADTTNAQPGIEYELMRDNGDGWRSDTGETPEQVVARRWTW